MEDFNFKTCFAALAVTLIFVFTAACFGAADTSALTAANGTIEVVLDSASAAMTVLDRRTSQRWIQKPYDSKGSVSNLRKAGDRRLRWDYKYNDTQVQCELEVDENRPEFVVTLAGHGSLQKGLQFPHPFITGAGTRLVLPMNEGISHPVEDTQLKLNPQYFTAKVPFYSGHMGMSMAFWAVADDETTAAHMAIVETPDDASLCLGRKNGLLCALPLWEASMGKFGYTRRIRYVFFDKGGHVAVCKRYRAYAKAKELFKTLEQKRQENPNVDMLIGAVNVWCWEKNAAEIVREMKQAGIERILWSKQQRDPNEVKVLNEMGGVLTSRYENYHDFLDPEVAKKIGRWGRNNWKVPAWPHDLVIRANGRRATGWEVKVPGQKSYWCNQLCERTAMKYTRDRVKREAASGETCRFLDVTTATPWNECYNPDHIMTRADSRRYRMELLRYMCEDMKLVTGSETGIDTSVPYLHYYEGMISLARYRVDDSGRNMRVIWDEVPDDVARYQMGHDLRLPLWELVYHDCVVSQWYWGDYNNKLPALWDKRDLFNILYATGPMFMFDKELWEKEKERFVQSYRNISPVTRATGYAEMTDHRFLTENRGVQQTKFSNGITVTVNFGDKIFELPDGQRIEGMNYHIDGI